MDADSIPDDFEIVRYPSPNTPAPNTPAKVTPSHRPPGSDAVKDITTGVALPTSVPRPPDFSSLPPSILHSGTVETLIALNDDLMARLKINIRRNSVLEGQILELEKLQDDLIRQNQGLAQQLELVQEKGVRSDQLHHRVAQLDDERRKLKAQMRADASFRRRVQAWVRPTLKRLKQELIEQTSKIQSLQAQLENREAQLGDIRVRMNEAVTHIQNQEKIFSQDQAKIVEQYETRQLTLEKEVSRFTAEIKVLKDKAGRVDQAISAKADAENHIVYLERRNQELEARLHQDIHQAQSETTRYRQEAKNLAAENLEIHRVLSEKTKLLDTQTSSLERLQDQFESLQSLYLESQKKVEGSRIAQENLNRLNQELSRQLKTQLNLGPATAVPIEIKENAPLNTGRAGNMDV